MWEVLLGSESGFESEVERRRRAVELVAEGVSKAEAARCLGRSRWWVVKWVKRFGDAGEAGLVDQSRAPKTQPARMPQAVVDTILEIRDRLEADPVASIGALSILATMERASFSPLPSIATIERILSNAGRARPTKRNRRTGVPLPLPVVSEPGVWQQADWIHDRYLEGGIKFSSLQLTDVGSHGMFASQYRRRTIRNAVTFLMEKAWPILSIPQALGTDNAFVHTTHRHNPFTEWARIGLYFGAEIIVGPPGELGWTNRVEAVNNLWQERTIWTQHFNTLDELRTESDRACDWLNTYRPVLDPTACGTRYPAEYIIKHTATLRWPPPITISDHTDSKDRLAVPLANGRITYLRHVTDNTITMAGARWHIPEAIPEGGLVTATITTGNQRLEIRHKGETVATKHYPIQHAVTNPYYPPADTSLLHHV